MKKFIFLSTIILSAIVGKAQLNPVSWTFTAKKVADKTYEVHMKATIQSGWHLYSQTQPEDAIVNPTTFTLNNNPLLIVDGKMKETGTIEKFHDAKLNISANQYSNTVDFVQKIKLKAKAKTNFSGNVEYQTCDDKKCLPPKTVNFSIAIQ
ncbi:MAG TPA: protein-disulfide reductase DsbD domain-containing protein [Chitinophagaceae bacterium]|nr:protein-disulfide reductase DsbD domain-containing protein [Chitinophagaceae bacterium]